MTTRVVRVAGLSVRYSLRAFAMSALLAILLAVLCGYALTVGKFEIPVGQVLTMLVGNPGPQGIDYVFWTVRMPRVLTAVLVGVMFGVAGDIIQSLSRNPLGSPDVLGFGGGAATGALLQILVFGASASAVAGGAIVGAFATAAVVYLIAYRRGVIGYRLVLAGIGIAALLTALNRYLLITAELNDAYRAAVWLTGSLLDRTWEHVTIATVAAGSLIPAALLMSRRLTLLEMGDDTSASLGVAPERSRAVLFVIAVGLTGAAVASAGPIAFIALAAPHIARRMVHAAGPSLIASGLVGAILLLGADLACQQVFPTGDLPAGVATGALGGLYLAIVLGTRWR
ncbi:iron complex transport system permease protein [Kibdelosporangium banguiense]|uniref:Iron complex transport system permease protein n=1 Tax=Kibdelosporangium banguiense TaxID=1365924 RepID=A0ABS4TR61_9PSEU|nr:iron chelate uptake ABC transporter family permease subunit [Kibdelosporangium banguiense]MBP2326435.1 iron complex transport system permease protein [Kibdelosporangium banguiense]